MKTLLTILVAVAMIVGYNDFQYREPNLPEAAEYCDAMHQGADGGIYRTFTNSTGSYYIPLHPADTRRYKLVCRTTYYLFGFEWHSNA